MLFQNFDPRYQHLHLLCLDLRTRSGFEKMESGVNARARDFARFGMLFAGVGDWEARQLISRGWVEESTRADTRTDPSLEYQYFW